jgi:hypothetical protein
MRSLQIDLTSTKCLDKLLPMEEDLENQTDGSRRQRLVQRLDQMVESGRVTDREAQRLRAAATPSEFDEIVLEIRLGHAGTRLSSAVADGTMPQEEADDLLERLRRGEHSRSLRTRLRGLRSADRSSRGGPASSGPQDTRQGS